MIKAFFNNESGSMTIEAAIITAALVALAIVFKEQLASLWDKTGQSMKDMENAIGT